MTSSTPSPASAGARHRVRLGNIEVDAVTEDDVVERVDAGWTRDEGGLIITPNIDIWRLAARDGGLANMIARARIVVADGMPLVWASKIGGDPLPERVTGSGLVERLSALAALRSKTVYIIAGGAEKSADKSASALRARYEGLAIVGVVVPPYGFEYDAQCVRNLVDQVVDARPDLVFVGLGFPKQERLAEQIFTELPCSWFLGCGGGIQMASGDARRAPWLAQRLGLEWIVRLVQEPRRLARRYLVNDAPAALILLLRSLTQRFIK